ncbi:MAG: TerB family tellurite resistance protein [Rhodospirillales bacterium]
MSYFEILANHFRLNRKRSDNFHLLKAAMAACAVVSAADGFTCVKESRRVRELMRALKLLQLYDVKLGHDLFMADSQRLLAEGDSVLPEMMEKVALADGDEEACRLIVELCKSISEADGIVYPSEDQAIERICALLHFDVKQAERINLPRPAEF